MSREAHLEPGPPRPRGALQVKPSRLQLVFGLDAALLISVCALERVPFTGLTLHEWLGLAFAAGAMAHVLLSWNWIASTTRKLVSPGSGRARVNYALNFALFACMTATVFSGVLISQAAIPALAGKPPSDPIANFAWEDIHDRLSDMVVILAGLHLAINWNWSVAAARKLWRGRLETTR